MEVEASAGTMTANGKTTVLITPPWRWVSASKLYIWVSAQQQLRRYSHAKSLGITNHWTTNHWTTNHWTGLDWNPKICFNTRWYAIAIK